MKKVAFFLLLIVVFFPEHSLKTNTYQEGLWTSSDLVKSTKTSDFVFKFGGKINGIKEWHRIQLGFPLKPITIDF